jgi:hypothetical protein
MEVKTKFPEKDRERYSAIDRKLFRRLGLTWLPGPKKFKRPNLAISSFKKGQILKNEKAK